VRAGFIRCLSVPWLGRRPTARQPSNRYVSEINTMCAIGFMAALRRPDGFRSPERCSLPATGTCDIMVSSTRRCHAYGFTKTQ
jgi:hypothetical protein